MMLLLPSFIAPWPCSRRAYEPQLFIVVWRHGAAANVRGMVIHRLFCNRETYARVVVCGDPNGFFNCLFGCILGWLAEGPVRIIRARVIAARNRARWIRSVVCIICTIKACRLAAFANFLRTWHSRWKSLRHWLAFFKPAGILDDRSRVDHVYHHPVLFHRF